MELSRRKYIRRLGKQLPGYSNGKPTDFLGPVNTPSIRNVGLDARAAAEVERQMIANAFSSKGSKSNTMSLGTVAEAIPQLINVAGAVSNSFGPVKSSDQIVQEAGTEYRQGAGFGYTAIKDINSGAQMSELKSESKLNTFATAESAAVLGGIVGLAAGGPAGMFVGTGAGTALGSIFGSIGGNHRKKRMRRRIEEALRTRERFSNFAQASGQSDYLEQNYLNEYGDAELQYVHAANGKDSGTGDDVVYTSGGKYVGRPNAKVAGGEPIIDNLENPDMTTATVVKDGKFGVDGPLAQVNKGTTILSTNVPDWRDGIPFGIKGAPAAEAIHAINQLEKKVDDGNTENRGLLGQSTIQFNKKQLAEAKEPYVNYLTDLAELQKYQHGFEHNNDDIIHAAKGKDSISILPNLTTSILGGISSLGQYFNAKNLSIRVPDIYAGNPYETAALNVLAGNRINEYPITNKMRDAEFRNRYSINRAGGLTGSQKYLANVAQTYATQRNIAELLPAIQEKNNAYRTQYAQSLLTAGAQRAQQQQAANEYRESYAAQSHAARQQGMEMGMRNFIDYANQFAANEFNRNMGNRMLELYNQNLDKDQQDYIKFLQNGGKGTLVRPISNKKRTRVNNRKTT